LFAHRDDSTEARVRLRSLLFVPGDRPDQMQKALGSGADALILDLEDSVALGAKAVAREHAAEFLARHSRSIRVFVRVNPLYSGLTDDDLAAIAAQQPDGLMLPKAEGAKSIHDLEQRMRALRLQGCKILPIATETPTGIFRMGEYVTVADRLAGVTWGAEDLSAAIGAISAREEDGRFTAPFEMLRALTLFSAHAAQVPAIETVYPAFRDHDGLSRFVSRSARDGFSGMMAIHPSQVQAINAAFTPSTAAVDRARRIVEEFDNHPGAGVLNIDGMMIDAPHLKQAQRVLALIEEADAAP
jgi:citrate lyase subunit beta / citryl-CoA lyase